MYLCNYNQKNVRKNTFLWAIGKIPLFMRFFIMFMFMSIGISYAETVHSQNAAMEFRFQDVTIEKALKEIEKKTGYNFFYNTKDFNVKRKISFSAKGMNLSEVLNGIFANSQVDYVINGTDIVLKRREEVSNVSNEKYQIKGSVRDGNGEPVIGASVVLKGHTETGVITDIDGNFVLTVPAKKVTLSISYIGYDPVNVEATVGTFVKVVMKESSQTLNEVVVVGYGTQKKESVVGSVQMVKPDELKVPSSQLSTGFAGRLAGVVAVQRSGEPGADGADFWIRGISTFNGTRSPLIIIDGVQASSGDLNAIDPEVIESFSVLKDATATALYGSRGANGVMIVKTKSGRESDKAIVNIRLENAYSTHTKTPKFVDGVRYMEMYNEAVLTRGTGEVLYSDNKIAGTRAGLDPLIYPNVNWYDELFRSGAMNQNINVTIRGGSKKLDYFSSVSVNHDSGVLRNTDDFSYKNNLNIMRYVFQNNFNLNLSKSSKLSLNLNVQLRDYSGPTSNTSDLFGMVMESNPVDFPVRFPDDPNVDYIRWGGKSGGKYNSGFRNPYAEMARGYQSQFESTVMANLKFEQKLDFITEGLSAEALFSFKNWSSTNTNRSAGYNQFQVINYNTDNLSDYTLNRIGSEQSTVLQTSNKSSGDRRLYIQAMINYNRTFNTVHNVSGMFLYNQDQYNGNAPEDLIESLLYMCVFAQAKEVKSLQSPRQWHVSISGNDSADGSATAPLRHIQTAAERAYPGDVVIVHEGVYRERVAPPRGGESKERPITYQAAEGEKVEIKGSEVIKNWRRLNNETWETVIPNSLFGDFNPYNDTIHGDWLARGQWSHTGEVYLNDRALAETEQLEDVLLNKGNRQLWYSKVGNDSTWIWANFPGCDPNRELVEINVRRTVFYPEKPFVNYITVRGFHVSQAATPWAPPTAEQIGAIGTHWSKGWTIEDNVVTHSKCVGITLGKYGDEWDNKAESVEGYVGTVKRALDNQWNREHIGSHSVRHNRVSFCGQAGIAGSLGAIFSTISDNVVHDIGSSSFWGYELAGIKLHAAIDAVIEHNHIYRTEGGIWLDWMTQGTRVTRNLLHDNRVQDFSLEVNHGPIIVDNNLFLSPELAQVKLSQGVAFVHNTIAWKIWPTGDVDERQTPYMFPHDTQIKGYHDCPCGNVCYFNNLLLRENLSMYENSKLPTKMEGNVVDTLVQYRVEEMADGWYLEFIPTKSLSKECTKALVYSQQLGEAVIPRQRIELPDGKKAFDKDYLGRKRKKRGNLPGAIEFKGDSRVRVKVYDIWN